MIRLKAVTKWNAQTTNRKLLEFISMVVEAGSMMIWSDAKRYHKFRNRTGELERSIRIEKIDAGTPGVVRYEVKAGIGASTGIRGMESSGVGAGGSTKASYALYVELGTVLAPAYPFLRPAMEKNRMKIINSAKKIFARFNNVNTVKGQ
jgi:HK97 gp10 family phage protein